LAHELAHTIQQGGAGRAGQAGGGGLIQARLLGTAAALAVVGTKGKKWGRLLADLRAYDNLESQQDEAIREMQHLRARKEKFEESLPGRVGEVTDKLKPIEDAVKQRYKEMKDALEGLLASINNWPTRSRHVKEIAEFAKEEKKLFEQKRPRLTE